MSESNMSYEWVCIKPNVTYDFFYQYPYRFLSGAFQIFAYLTHPIEYFLMQNYFGPFGGGDAEFTNCK